MNRSTLVANAVAAGMYDKPEPIEEGSSPELDFGHTETAASESLTADPAKVTEVPPLHLADARGIAGAALAYQARMAAAGHTVSAAAAVAAVTARQGVQQAKSKVAAAPTAATIAAFYADVSARWKSSPSIQQGFANFVAYQTSREIAFCRENAVGIEQLRGETDVAGDFLSRMTPFGCTLSSEAVTKVIAAHASWLASADLRQEFVSFDSYARHVLGSRRA